MNGLKLGKKWGLKLGMTYNKETKSAIDQLLQYLINVRKVPHALLGVKKP